MRKLHSLLSICISFGALSSPCAGAATAEEINEVKRLHQSGQSTLALALADQLLLNRPTDAPMRFIKGVMLAQTQRNAEAIEVFQKLTDDFPELAEPYNNLAALYAGRGDYERARTALEQALRSNPNYAVAHENLGDVYAMLASRAYARALALDPASDQMPRKLELAKELIRSQANAPPAKPPQ